MVTGNQIGRHVNPTSLSGVQIVAVKLLYIISYMALIWGSIFPKEKKNI
jgi:hypothetical protein